MMFAIINTVYLKKKNISVVSIEHFLSHKKKFVKQLKTIAQGLSSAFSYFSFI
jgi:vacuolar-type H+-ATPase subunit C/Vma6